MFPKVWTSGKIQEKLTKMAISPRFFGVLDTQIVEINQFFELVILKLLLEPLLQHFYQHFFKNFGKMLKQPYPQLWYKIKNVVQKSTLPEAKIFRDFHSQMQFSINKLHFPDEKSANFSPAPSAPAKFFAYPKTDLMGEAPFTPKSKLLIPTGDGEP